MSNQSLALRKRFGALLQRIHQHPLVLPVTIFLALFFASLVLFITSGATTLGASDARVVNLSIDGVNQSLPTRAKTVAELLERLDVEVSETDVIEPSLSTEISGDDFSINLYRSRNVLIVDGDQRVFAETANPAPRGVVEEVGIEVHPDDIVEKDTSEPIDAVGAIREGVISERIIIERSTPLLLNLFGVDYELRTHADTVEELLLERGITLAEAAVFPEPDEVLEPDMAVFVTDPNKEIVMEEESIEQPQEYVDDYDILIGNSEIREEGRPGKRVVVYEISVDGSRSILDEVIVQQPITQVVAQGRKPPTVVGDRAEVMRAAGISQSEFYYVDIIIQKESNWGVTAQNVSSGAYGLCQALPGAKMASAGSDWPSNPVTQLRWCDSYAKQRYGSWSNAFDFWQRNRWW